MENETVVDTTVNAPSLGKTVLTTFVLSAAIAAGFAAGDVAVKSLSARMERRRANKSKTNELNESE